MPLPEVKKLTLGHKQNTPQSHDFKITTTKPSPTLHCKDFTITLINIQVGECEWTSLDVREDLADNVCHLI